MKPYRYPISKFLTISVGIAGFANFLVRQVQSYFEFHPIVIVGLVSSIVGIFWVAFDRIMWRWPLLQKLGLSDLPDLSGIWLGDVDRLGEKSPHKFQMTIYQTYTNISIQTNTTNSKSHSISANFMVDETGKKFDLINYWLCRTKKIGNDQIHEDFKGMSHIDICTQSNETVLEDYYFTDRNPPTQGKIRLSKSL